MGACLGVGATATASALRCSIARFLDAYQPAATKAHNVHGLFAR